MVGNTKVFMGQIDFSAKSYTIKVVSSTLTAPQAANIGLGKIINSGYAFFFTNDNFILSTDLQKKNGIILSTYSYHSCVPHNSEFPTFSLLEQPATYSLTMTTDPCFVTSPDSLALSYSGKMMNT